MRIYALNPVNKNSLYSRNHRHGFNSAVSFRSMNFLELPEKDVFQRIEESLVPENFLGQGTEAEVYKIKDTDYCVRIPYGASDMYMFTYTKELTPIDKLNHIVARLGSGASIMKYFRGQTPKENMNNERYRHEFQEKIANMSVKSYTGLLHQIAEAIDNEVLFDYSGGNLIVDTDKQKLTAIDFYGISDNPREEKPLSEMYSVLTCYGSKKETGKKIYDKIVLAGLEEFKPGNIPCMDVELFDFVDLALKRKSDNDGYREKGFLNNTNMFYRLTDTITESFTNLKKIKRAEIVDKSYSKALEEQIVVFRRLMTKIH